MTLEDLRLQVQKTDWFEHLSEPISVNETVHIPNLNPWAHIPTGDDRLEQIADQMDWLPSSRDQNDPIHGEAFEKRSEKLDQKQNHSRQCLEIYKVALASLRKFDGHSSLKVGPHDFTEAARGSALYAARRAAYEILLDECGFWCSMMTIYSEGHWPCGILPDGSVVVL